MTLASRPKRRKPPRRSRRRPLFQPVRRRLRHHRPKSFGKRQIGTPTAILIGRKGRQVDGVSNHAVCKVVPHLHRNLRPNLFLSFGRRSRNVWRRQNVRQPDERCVLRRFLDEYVQRRAGKVSGADFLRMLLDDQSYGWLQPLTALVAKADEADAEFFAEVKAFLAQTQ